MNVKTYKKIGLDDFKINEEKNEEITRRRKMINVNVVYSQRNFKQSLSLYSK